VICPPDGTWYIDPTGTHNTHGWPTRKVNKTADAKTICY